VVMGVDYSGYYTLDTGVGGDARLELTLPKHGVASLVVLTRDLGQLKSIRDWLKFRESTLS